MNPTATVEVSLGQDTPGGNRYTRQIAEAVFIWNRLLDRIETWYYELIETHAATPAATTLTGTRMGTEVEASGTHR